MIDDSDILAALREQPEQGLALALAAYGGLVKSIILTVLPEADRRDAEECVADVFLRLYQNAGRFRPDGGSLKNYLCGIARHVAIDRGRRLRRQEFLPLTAAELGLESDFVQGLERRETAAAVQSAVLNLASPDKEIFVLRYFFNQRVAAIAERLELDEKAVENRLYRGRKHLKAELLRQGVSVYA